MPSKISATFRHVGRVSRAVFSPNGRRVVTVSDDQTAKLWDLDLVTQYRGPDLRDVVCNERLNGAMRFTSADAIDPILRRHEGEDVCASGPLSSSYWVNLARDLVNAVRMRLSPQGP
jgi:WD40 repeat protein